MLVTRSGFGGVMVALSLALAACTHDASPSPAPGAFSVARLDGAASSAKTIRVPPAQTKGSPPAGDQAFDVGDVAGTDDFLFSLANTGDTPITGITLSSSVAAFQVAPQSIGTLAPIAQVAVGSIVRVRVIHGTNPVATGHLPALPMGANEADVTISGQTTDASGAASTVSYAFKVKLNALLANFEVYTGTTPIDLTQPTGGMQGICELYAAPPVIKNTGNVPLRIDSMNPFQAKLATLGSETIAPGAQTTALVSTPSGYGLLIDPKGVTFAPDKYLLVQGAYDGAMVLCFD